MAVVTERESSILKEIAQEAGGLLMSLYGQELEMIQKGHHDFATSADIKSQELIIERLKEVKLPYTIVAEEKMAGVSFPLRLGTDGVLYVDPLEGTHNFARKRKEFGFGVTLGLVRDGQPAHVVFCNPVSGDLYHATKGEGAYLNGERIHVSERAERLDILFNHWPDLRHVGSYLDRLRNITEYTPTSCSDAVDLWMVARGSADGLVFIYRQADTHDLISALGVEEAGGRVTDRRGSQWYSANKQGLISVRNSLIAGNPLVHQRILNEFA